MLVVLVVLSFLLMTFDIRSSGGGVAGTLREGTQAVFAPVQEFATTLISPVVDFVDGLANLAGLRDENESLRRRISELEARIDEVGSLEAEVATLRGSGRSHTSRRIHPHQAGQSDRPRRQLRRGFHDRQGHQ